MLKKAILISLMCGFFLIGWAGGLTAKEKPMTITCKGRLDMDYARNVAVFNDDVRVEDERMLMKADRMKVFFESGTREIKKVIATGKVRFKKDDRSAKARKALYTASDGRVVLTGDPKVKKGLDIITGDKITFFRTDNRMLVEPSAKLILYSGDQQQLEKDWL